MKVVRNLEQGSQEWLDARMGKITSTKLKAVMGSSLGKYQLMAEMIAETGTERSKLVRASVEMERGTYEEPFAIKRFEELTGKEVENVAFCVSDENPLWINSPDGLVVTKGKNVMEAVEVKSFDSRNHILFNMMNTFDDVNMAIPASKRTFFGVPAENKWQVVHYFIVNPNLKILWFLYWDSRFLDEEKQLEIIKVNANDEVLQKHITDAKDRLEKYETEYEFIKDELLKTNF